MVVKVMLVAAKVNWIDCPFGSYRTDENVTEYRD